MFLHLMHHLNFHEVRKRKGLRVGVASRRGRQLVFAFPGTYCLDKIRIWTDDLELISRWTAVVFTANQTTHAAPKPTCTHSHLHVQCACICVRMWPCSLSTIPKNHLCIQMKVCARKTNSKIIHEYAVRFVNANILQKEIEMYNMLHSRLSPWLIHQFRSLWAFGRIYLFT